MCGLWQLKLQEMAVYTGNGKLMRKLKGFTLIEMLIVMALISILYSAMFPKSQKVINHSKETVLKYNLRTMRDCIDKFYGDFQRYPSSLQELVSERYLREIPVDPVAESASLWKTISSDQSVSDVFDVRSSLTEMDSNGVSYEEY